MSINFDVSRLRSKCYKAKVLTIVYEYRFKNDWVCTTCNESIKSGLILSKKWGNRPKHPTTASGY